MTTYPNYTGLDAVYFYLGASHFMIRQYDQSAPFFTKVISDYPNSKLAKDATKRLQEIPKLKAAAAETKVKKS